MPSEPSTHTATTMPPAIDSSQPVFVLCTSRSGSTLLRYVLDSHPQLGCPPEMHLGPLARQLCWSYALAAGLPVLAGNDAAEVEDAGVLARCAETIEQLMAGYLERVGKQRWCEKSVTSVDHAELLARIFPAARFVCLYRNCMDVVHSGLEVSRHGFAGYGFAEFVARQLDNSVAGIAEYWCDKAGKIAQFERDHPERCLRLRYEDLVYRSAEVVPCLLEFIGVDADPGLMERVFTTSHQDGPGDANILFSRRVETRSVGKGSSVPVRLLPPPLLARVNALLEAVDYPTIGPDWGTRSSPYVHASASALAPPTVSDASPGDALRTIWEALGRSNEPGVVRFVFEEAEEQPWHVAFGSDAVSIGQGDATADCDVRMPLAQLHAMAEGRVNPMALIRSGEMRVSGNVDVLRKAFQL
jgi:protein-tyrosine sulfotransferase